MLFISFHGTEFSHCEPQTGHTIYTFLVRNHLVVASKQHMYHVGLSSNIHLDTNSTTHYYRIRYLC